MKKLFQFLAIIVFTMILSINLVTSKSSKGSGRSVELINIKAIALAQAEGGNEATCYSTYTPAWLGGTMIWVCGSCVQAKASSFSDSGICYF